MLALRTHNILDYCLGAAFLLSPYLFGFSRLYFAHDVFLVIGLAMLGYSLLSDYRYSLIKVIPVGMHMSFDVACGVFAVLAPWIYGYRDELTALQSAVHWILGMGAIASALMSERTKEPSVVVLAPENQGRKEERRQSKQAA